MKFMRNILVFDAGATKTEIVAIQNCGVDSTCSCFNYSGLNAAVMDEHKIRQGFHDIKSMMPELQFSEIHYFGAGCTTESIRRSTADFIKEVWDVAEVEVASDILGAARGLLGRDAGVACIMGTGSNSALYDGRDIVYNVAPLGYVLGDEGSGSALGKRLLGDIFKGIAPKDIIEKFEAEVKLTKDEVVENVYRGSNPTRFLASVCPFISGNIRSPYIENLVKDEFGRFIDRNVKQYRKVEAIPVSFTGSIAFYFREQLQSAMSQRGLRIGIIARRPMDGLIQYYQSAIR